MDTWSSIERLAGRQQGVVARWQVVALGMSTRTFSAFADRHGWINLRPGIWAAPWSRESYARRCIVERISGPRCRVLTGASVLTLGGVRLQQPSRIELLTAPDLSVARRPGVYVYRGGWVAGDRLMRLHGIPAAPWLRAVTDAAARSSVDRLKRDIAALDRMRKATPAEAAAYLSRRGRFPGRPKVVAALRALEVELVHSDDEARARRHLRTAGLDLHPRPLLVAVRHRRFGEVDIPVCAHRYGMEVDGPSHLLDGAAEADEVRDRRLRRLGWRIDRFTDVEVRTDPGAVVEAVRAGLAEQVARGVAPWPCGVCAS